MLETTNVFLNTEAIFLSAGYNLWGYPVRITLLIDNEPKTYDLSKIAGTWLLIRRIFLKKGQKLLVQINFNLNQLVTADFYNEEK